MFIGKRKRSSAETSNPTLGDRREEKHVDKRVRFTRNQRQEGECGSPPKYGGVFKTSLQKLGAEGRESESDDDKATLGTDYKASFRTDGEDNSRKTLGNVFSHHNQAKDIKEEKNSFAATINLVEKTPSQEDEIPTSSLSRPLKKTLYRKKKTTKTEKPFSESDAMFEFLSGQRKERSKARKAAKVDILRFSDEEASDYEQPPQETDDSINRAAALKTQKQREKLDRNFSIGQGHTLELVQAIKEGKPIKDLPADFPTKLDLLVKLYNAWNEARDAIEAIQPSDLLNEDKMASFIVHTIIPAHNCALALRLWKRDPKDLIDTKWDIKILEKFNEMLGGEETSTFLLQSLKEKVNDLCELFREAHCEMEPASPPKATSPASSPASSIFSLARSIASVDTAITTPDSSPALGAKEKFVRQTPY